MSESRKLFNKPAGPSERIWNNKSMGTSGQILCEACGTVHSALAQGDSAYIIDTVLGSQVVEECCGKVIDTLYKEFGQVFCLTFLDDFAKDPTNPRFSLLRIALQNQMERARDNCAKVQAELDAIKPPPAP